MINSITAKWAHNNSKKIKNGTQPGKGKKMQGKKNCNKNISQRSTNW